MDANCMYRKVQVRESYFNKTWVTINSCTYYYRRMTSGLRNAPETFQNALIVILSRVGWKGCLIYLDDVMVFSVSDGKHLSDVEATPQLPRNSEVTFKQNKCALFSKRV